jgi:hypothetical protein
MMPRVGQAVGGDQSRETGADDQETRTSNFQNSTSNKEVRHATALGRFPRFMGKNLWVVVADGGFPRQAGK